MDTKLKPTAERSGAACRSCPVHSSCRTGAQADGDALSGGRLVGQATAYFLMPLAAAIVAAAAVEGETARILAGCGAFVAAVAAAALVGRWARRRRKRPR